MNWLKDSNHNMSIYDFTHDVYAEDVNETPQLPTYGVNIPITVYVPVNVAVSEQNELLTYSILGIKAGAISDGIETLPVVKSAYPNKDFIESIAADITDSNTELLQSTSINNTNPNW